MTDVLTIAWPPSPLTASTFVALRGFSFIPFFASFARSLASALHRDASESRYGEVLVVVRRTSRHTNPNRPLLNLLERTPPELDVRLQDTVTFHTQLRQQIHQAVSFEVDLGNVAAVTPPCRTQLLVR